MNKTLIALAVAGVMAAPMAAQADATIYGKIHVSIDSGDNGDPGANSSMYWQSNSSRIGFKGSEDLGGGLKAIWQFESNASFGSGNTTWGGRNSYVGLAGGWGMFMGGRHDTPFKSTGRKFDLFGDQVGDTRNLIGKGAYSFDSRPGNVIAYGSPTFGGSWKVLAAYVLEDGGTNTDALSINAGGNLGPVFLGVAYETHGQGIYGGTADESGIRVGASWKTGAIKLNGFYETLTDIGGVSGADAQSIAVGGAFTMGKNVLKAQYTMVKNDPTPDSDATNLAVGWDYKMSKRSTVYLAYSTTSNDANASFCADCGGHGGEIGAPGTAGSDPSVISAGMVHKF